MMMQCANGHSYDPDRTGGICPLCAGQGRSQDFGLFEDIGKTVPAGNAQMRGYGATEPAVRGYGGDSAPQQGAAFQEYGATVPASGGAAEQQPPAEKQFENTFHTYPLVTPSGNRNGQGAGASQFQEYGATMPAAKSFGQAAPPNYGFPGGRQGDPAYVRNFDGRTPRGDDPNRIPDFDGRVTPYTGVTEPPPVQVKPVALPVVGWLVCTNGADCGRSYQIHPENNYVGRGEGMDIRITGDQQISRENQFVIAYVTKTRKFYIGSGGGRNIVELNDLPLMQREELHPYDLITIGSTSLRFVPFCGEQFGWDDLSRERNG